MDQRHRSVLGMKKKKEKQVANKIAAKQEHHMLHDQKVVLGSNYGVFVPSCPPVSD